MFGGGVMECVLIERDPMVSSLVRQFVTSVAGMEISAEYRDLPDIADSALESAEIVLLEHPATLDIMELLRRMHSIAPSCSVVLLSESRRADDAIRAFESGAFDLLLRPFSFERLRDALENVVAYRRFMATVPAEVSQSAVDDLRGIRSASAPSSALPMNIVRQTMDLILDALEQGESMTAEEVAASAGLSRPTAWRYLEHLCRSGQVMSSHGYRPKGRPVRRYSLLHR
jgi:two-component system response regulator DctR